MCRVLKSGPAYQKGPAITSIRPSPLMSAVFTPSHQYSPVSVSFWKAISRGAAQNAAAELRRKADRSFIGARGEARRNTTAEREQRLTRR